MKKEKLICIFFTTFITTLVIFCFIYVKENYLSGTIQDKVKVFMLKNNLSCFENDLYIKGSDIPLFYLEKDF